MNQNLPYNAPLGLANQPPSVPLAPSEKGGFLRGLKDPSPAL